LPSSQAQRQKVVDLKVDPEKQKSFSLEEELQVGHGCEKVGPVAATFLSEHIVLSIPDVELSQHMLQKLRDSVDINNYENKPVPRTEDE